LENITRILFDLFLMFAVAKLLGELFERARQPAVVGEIMAGILLGPYILNMIGPSHFYTVLAEIGVIILLFNVGLHTRTEDMLRVGPTSLVVAIYLSFYFRIFVYPDNCLFHCGSHVYWRSYGGNICGYYRPGIG
jgi:Kef-type K+ transport system membrane component KefB